jgi:hypothetical protein
VREVRVGTSRKTVSGRGRESGVRTNSAKAAAIAACARRNAGLAAIEAKIYAGADIRGKEQSIDGGGPAFGVFLGADGDLADAAEALGIKGDAYDLGRKFRLRGKGATFRRGVGGIADRDGGASLVAHSQERAVVLVIVVSEREVGRLGVTSEVEVGAAGTLDEGSGDRAAFGDTPPVIGQECAGLSLRIFHRRSLLR